MELTENDFKATCRKVVRKFLEEYTSDLKSFDRNHLNKLKQIHPEFFTKRTNEENRGLFVEWHLDKNRVRVAGLKKDVEAKLREIINFVNSVERT